MTLDVYRGRKTTTQQQQHRWSRAFNNIVQKSPQSEHGFPACQAQLI